MLKRLEEIVRSGQNKREWIPLYGFYVCTKEVISGELYEDPKRFFRMAVYHMYVNASLIIGGGVLARTIF